MASRRSAIRPCSRAVACMVLLMGCTCLHAVVQFLEVEQFGRDSVAEILGGCETDVLGTVSPGFPDRYMDAGEVVQYGFAVQSLPAGDFGVLVTLEALAIDPDSPSSCASGSRPCRAARGPGRRARRRADRAMRPAHEHRARPVHRAPRGLRCCLPRTRSAHGSLRAVE